jgi:hypothetical protein
MTSFAETLPAESEELPVLPKGTKVRLKPTILGAALGIAPYKKKGGEAVVAGSSLDSSGRVVYQVSLTKCGRSRTVYRSDLVVHRP